VLPRVKENDLQKKERFRKGELFSKKNPKRSTWWTLGKREIEKKEVCAWGICYLLTGLKTTTRREGERKKESRI